ncbi:MAG: M81 family metallopeptidase, partial [Gemmataceae bacterium]
MRVGIVCLMHESNTFASGVTGLNRFQNDTLAVGNAARQRFAGTHHEVGGFLEQIEADGHEAVMVFAAWTLPSGPITADAAEELTRRAVQAVATAGPLDGVYLAPHGAAVAESYRDFDGHWMTSVRAVLPAGIPVVATLDLHANLSPRMVSAVDVVFAYRTNPHIDMRATGQQAASLMHKVLQGEAKPVTASVFLPMVVNIEAQATAEFPCRDLASMADAMRARPGVLAVSVLLGFPYADVAEMGA